MFWYKSCPKCKHGDLVLEQDSYGWYRQCVQCGYLQEVSLEKTSGKAPAAVAVKAVQRVA